MSLTPEEVRQRFLASLRAPKAASRAPAQRKLSQVAPAPTPAPSAVAASVVRGTATSSLSTLVAQRTQPPQAIGTSQHISVPFVAKTPQSQQAAAPPPRKKTVDAPSALDAVLAAERVRQGSVAFLDTPVDSALEEAGEVPLNASYYGKKTASEEARDLASTYEGGFAALSPRSQARYEGEQQLMVEAAQQREERKKREALYEDAMRKSSGNSMDSEAEGDVRTQKANAYKQKRNDKHDSSVRDALEGDATSTTSVIAETTTTIARSLVNSFSRSIR